MADYKAMTNRPIFLGAGGLPRAMPYFGSMAEDIVRHEGSCCGPPPGPKVPLQWYDAGFGWVTKYFTDVIPYDRRTSTAGRFRCQLRDGIGQQCPFEVQDEPPCCACKGTPCWSGSGTIAFQMMQHIASHGIIDPAMKPPPRMWSSGLFDTEGCLDVWCCAPCNGSRQMMALAGWEDTMDAGWCVWFTLLGLRIRKVGNYLVVYYVPPHFYVALMTRPIMLRLNNIDEGCCTTIMTVTCCPVCSVAQTNRELSYSGVWPGSSCGGDKPANYSAMQMNGVPMMKMM